jgi:hypothetical protein
MVTGAGEAEAASLPYAEHYLQDFALVTVWRSGGD